MVILVTGCAGFIGSHLTDRLLNDGYKVVGIDNFNDYYDPKVKEKNLADALTHKNFKLYRKDILEFEGLRKIFDAEKPQKVIHLAARAGVRPSTENVQLYAEVNVLGTVNLLKLAADFDIEQFIFGSSSSVYGNSKVIPFLEDDPCETIISPYGSSKRAAEFWVETFYKTNGLNCVVLRFFTVYGPRGRSDMAPALFTRAILAGKTIKQFGDGTSSRDYTHVEDIVEGIIKSLDIKNDFEVINLGNNQPIKLSDFIKLLEKLCEKKAKIQIQNNQIGDVEKTWASIEKANRILAWSPKVKIGEGLFRYIEWLKNT